MPIFPKCQFQAARNSEINKEKESTYLPGAPLFGYRRCSGADRAVPPALEAPGGPGPALNDEQHIRVDRFALHSRVFALLWSGQTKNRRGRVFLLQQ